MADGCNNNTDHSWSITGARVQGSIPRASKWKKAVFKIEKEKKKHQEKEEFRMRKMEKGRQSI